MKIKRCVICGDEFMPKSSRQKYCNKLVIRKCANCGADYESKCTLTYPSCCSQKCQNEYAHKQSVSYYANHPRKCALCGKEFIPKNNTQSVCPDIHYRECVICGKSFSIEKYRSGGATGIPQTCSKECATQLKFINGNPFSKAECREKAKQTMIDKYGVDHPMHSEEFKGKMDSTMQNKYGVKRFPQLKEAYKEKSIQTNREKFGADWKSQTEDWKSKTEDTLMKHYGVTNPFQSEELRKKGLANYKVKTGYDNPMQNPDVQNKMKQTNKDRYGVEHALQSPDIQARVKQTMIDRYDAPYVLQSPKLVEKIKETNIQKYGFPNAAQNPEIQSKIADTMTRKYGRPHYRESLEFHKAIMIDPSKEKELEAFLNNPEEFIKLHFKDKPTYKQVEEASGASASTVYWCLSKHNKLDMIKYSLSYFEEELITYIKEINPNIQITRHRRDLIKPYEIDIYLPEYKIGIEMNPTWTHNSSFPSHGHDSVTPPSYHRMKSDLCEKSGIFLFHVFGYEWTHKRDIVISMLRNLIGNNLNKVYARNCEIRTVPGKDSFEFLQTNHRQGGVHSKVRLGLYHNDELVSLMTFGKLRNTLGLGNEDFSDCWELVRFCNKLNTSVVGGASKLFTYFIKRYSPVRIRSFSDRAHTRGALYKTLGFDKLSTSNENYVWVDTRDDKAYNRVNAQKHNLKNFLQDDNIDLSKTEREIMESHGYAQVYDSGTITWQWTAPQ